VTNTISAITTRTIIECTLTDLPNDVIEEVRRLWTDNEYGNDTVYHGWSGDSKTYLDPECVQTEADLYPVIAKYVADNNLERPLIHWWW